jgi:segregation and condensation protein B
MNEAEIKNIVEAALLAAGRPLSIERLIELFAAKGTNLDRAVVRSAIGKLSDEYAGRGIEIKEVANGYRIQIRHHERDWLEPLFEERAPRYTRALLETLALIAYRQPITRAEIEGVRGVVVSSNIVRTLMERGWVRVVGYRDVPGKPSMLGTTREFLDYFGLKKLDDLPPLAELKDIYPEESPQSDLVDALEGVELGPVLVAGEERALIDDDADADEWADESEPRPAIHLVTESESS